MICLAAFHIFIFTKREREYSSKIGLNGMKENRNWKGSICLVFAFKIHCMKLSEFFYYNRRNKKTRWKHESNDARAFLFFYTFVVVKIKKKLLIWTEDSQHKRCSLTSERRRLYGSNDNRKEGDLKKGGRRRMSWDDKP